MLMHCMTETSKKVHHLHHHIKLSNKFHHVITWWFTYIPTWNGVSFLYNTFLLTSPDCQLFTDASDTCFGCFFQGQWCQGFPVLTFGDQDMSMNWWEWFAATIALNFGAVSSLLNACFCIVTLLVRCTSWPTDSTASH